MGNLIAARWCGWARKILDILNEIREKIGKTFGDEVEVTLEEDIEPRLVQVPPDFQAALDGDAAAKAAFERMSYIHQKEYVQFVLDARHTDTRQKRIEKNLAPLKKSGKAK